MAWVQHSALCGCSAQCVCTLRSCPASWSLSSRADRILLALSSQTPTRARQGNFTNCTTNDAFKAANGGFLGPMCYACLAPPCTPPAPPSPTPGPSKPTPAPPASLVRLQSASSAGMCLVAAAGSKSAVVQLVECTAAKARCWSVEKGKGLFYLGSGFCLRPQNPPEGAGQLRRRPAAHDRRERLHAAGAGVAALRGGGVRAHQR